MGHSFSKQIMEKCRTNMEMGTIFWDTQNGNKCELHVGTEGVYGKTKHKDK